jgi:SAM-dependent methyltransferase
MLGRLAKNLAWKRHAAICMAFDAFHGVNTIAGAPAIDISVTSPNRDEGIPYDASPWTTLRRCLVLANLDPHGFLFVDIGCGKGKVVLSAMEMPFQRIIGVDFSPTLCEVAKTNIKSARFVKRRCSSVEIVCSDATEWEPPPNEKTIFFFANPFNIKLTEAVMRNIIVFNRRNPLPIFFIFYRMSSSVRRIDDIFNAEYDRAARKIVSTKLSRDASLNIWQVL